MHSLNSRLPIQPLRPLATVRRHVLHVFSPRSSISSCCLSGEAADGVAPENVGEERPRRGSLETALTLTVAAPHGGREEAEAAAAAGAPTAPPEVPAQVRSEGLRTSDFDTHRHIHLLTPTLLSPSEIKMPDFVACCQIPTP